MLVDGPTWWTRDAPGKPRGRAQCAAAVGLLVTTVGVAALLLLWWGRPAAAETAAPGSLPTDAEAPGVEGTTGATGTTTAARSVGDGTVADVTVPPPEPDVGSGVVAPAGAGPRPTLGTAVPDAASSEPFPPAGATPDPVGLPVPPPTAAHGRAPTGTSPPDPGGRGQVDDRDLVRVRWSLPGADGLVHLPGGRRSPVGGTTRAPGPVARLPVFPPPAAPGASVGPGAVAQPASPCSPGGCLTSAPAAAPFPAMPRLSAPAPPGRDPGGEPPSEDDSPAGRSSGASAAVAVLTAGASLPGPARLGRTTEPAHPLPDHVDIPVLLPD